MPEATDQDPQLYARSFADVYDAWYRDLDEQSIVVDAFVHRLSERGRLLELGSGTGRLATPLAAAGFEVIALDASVPMLLQDRAAQSRVAADMASPPIRDTSMAGVLIAYNTFFNLEDRASQQRCLQQAGRVLAPDGLLAIDGFVSPAAQRNDHGITIRDHPTRPKDRLAIVTGPDPDQPDAIIGSHIELGASTTCRPWRLTYCEPTELDALAAAANLELVERSAGWVDEPYGADSLRAVSWYRLNQVSPT